MSFDTVEWKKKVAVHSRPKKEYVIEYDGGVATFLARPRTPALEEEVYAYVYEDSINREEFIAAVNEGREPERRPDPEYIVRWKLFKLITKGDFDKIEEDLKNRLDLDVIDRAISDFFGI